MFVMGKQTLVAGRGGGDTRGVIDKAAVVWKQDSQQ